MKPEEQRIKIAEACGWKLMSRPPKDPKSLWPDDAIWEMMQGTMLPPNGRPLVENGRMNQPPDYLNDLNAMHEAEKVLTPRQQEVYASILGPIIWLHDDPYIPENDHDYIGYIEYPASDTFECYHATAAQRAETFLRTLGLWKD